MANIAVLVDIEQGHIFSSLNFARKLKARGHSVCYVGVADVEEMIRRQGMEFRSFLPDLMPLGSAAKLRTQFVESNRTGRKFDKKQFFHIAPLLQGKMLDSIIQELKPDVMLVTCCYFEAIAIRYKYDLPVVLLEPVIRNKPKAEACQMVLEQLLEVPGALDLIGLLESAGVTIRNFDDVGNLLLSIPELVFLPRAFELPGSTEEELVFHIGPEIDLDRTEEPFDWEQLSSNSPLIYCSLGSQLDMESETSRRFIRTVIEAVTARPDRQSVVSLGSRMDPKEFMPVASHVLLRRWLPQLQMLSRANVMITHAGAGTVKECIMKGVPMLAVPLMRDQFDCADRVVHHGLGLRADIERSTAEQISSMLEQLLVDDSYRARVDAMREEFRRIDAMNIGVNLIEEVAAGAVPVKHFVACN